MCKKLLLLTSLILMLVSVGHAEDIQWTGAGRNKFWGTAANWDLGRPPTLADDVRLDVPAAAAPNGPIIQDGVTALANGIFTEAAGEPTLTMTGGTLDVTDWIWWGDGQDSYGVWTMSGGTVTVTNEFELGWGGGAGTLTMTGGTINAGELVVPTGTGAFGLLYLYGGTINVTKPGGLEVNVNGLIDMTEGVLVLEGDETATINDLFEAGLMTSYAGEGILNVDYDLTTPGKTTVTAGFVPAPIEPVRPSAAGLLAYYPFENDANDLSGNGNDGTIMGDPEFVEGISGLALAFDGDGDIIDCGNDPSLALTGAVTLAAWVNVGVPGLDHKVGGNQDGANGGYKMSVYGDKIEFEIRTAANSAVLNRSVEGGTILEPGVWYHVAGVYSLEDGYIRTYVDGALDRELLTTEELGASPGNFFIGCEPFNTGSYNFNGIMDEVYLYNTALSEGEVMYVAGHRAVPLDPGTENLVAHYEFENDVNDSSGNGLHGTMVGDPQFVEGPPGFGMALDLDGDDYIDCGNPPEFSITDQISFAYWIKVRAFDADWNTVIAKGDDSWRSSRAGTNNFMEAAVGGTSGNYLYGVTPVDDEQWHHVGAVYDGSTFKIYVDGELDAWEESTGQIAISSHNVCIGENLDATGRFWNGLIDDVVIYNRALTAGEVLYLTGARAPVVFFADDFEGYADDAELTAAGWTILDTPEAIEQSTWTITNPGGRTNPATLDGSASTGQFLISDSDQQSESNPVDSGASHDISTPSFSTLGHTTVWLHADVSAQLNNNGAAIFDVEVSTDGGGTWTNVFSCVSPGRVSSNNATTRLPDNTNADGYFGRLNVDLSAVAADEPDVQVRFRHYEPNWDWWIAIDNVLIDDVAAPQGGPVTVFLEDFSNGLGQMNVFSGQGNTGTETWHTSDKGGRYVPGTVQEHGVNRLGPHPNEHPEFAIIDSDADPDPPEDEWLMTPSLDLSGMTEVFLHYESETVMSGVSNQEVLVSLDGGNTFRATPIFAYTGGGLFDGGEEPVFAKRIFDVSAIAAGQSQVVFAFRYTGDGDDWWWAIDNVEVSGLPSSPSQADPSLSIYYSFDEVGDVVADLSGNGHDGVVVGEVTADPEGLIAGAAKFSNAGYLDLDGPNVAAEDIPTSGMTLAAWIKCENTGDHHAIFNARASDETWVVHPEARSNGEFRWLLRSYGSITMFDVRAGAVTWDEWLHFAGTYDKASAKAALCINGELVSEMDVANPDDIAGDWALGARVGKNIDDVRPFTGLMDEFRLMTRALSQDEILDMMAGM